MSNREFYIQVRDGAFEVAKKLKAAQHPKTVRMVRIYERLSAAIRTFDDPQRAGNDPLQPSEFSYEFTGKIYPEFEQLCQVAIDAGL